MAGTSSTYRHSTVMTPMSPTALPTLPGGTVEGTDTGPEDTLHQEAADEVQLTLTEPVLLAHPHPGSRAPGLGRQERGKPNSPLKQPVPAGACPPLRGGVGTAPWNACEPKPPREPATHR